MDNFAGFVLSLLSSAVVTFSPIATLRTEIERANDDESLVMPHQRGISEMKIWSTFWSFQGKSFRTSINGPFSIVTAILNNQMVHL